MLLLSRLILQMLLTYQSPAHQLSFFYLCCTSFAVVLCTLSTQFIYSSFHRNKLSLVIVGHKIHFHVNDVIITVIGSLCSENYLMLT